MSRALKMSVREENMVLGLYLDEDPDKSIQRRSLLFKDFFIQRRGDQNSLQMVLRGQQK
jgi:hypothetical protein